MIYTFIAQQAKHCCEVFQSIYSAILLTLFLYVLLQPRAKAIRKYVDKMIGLAKDGSLHARRQALAFVYDDALVKSLFEQVPSRYGERNGGYCRVKTELQKRRGDNAEMATIELV